MDKVTTFSSATLPLGKVLKLRWAELPRLRELLSRVVPLEQDTRPYLVASDAIESEYILTLLTSHALCEALINCTLALALAERGKADVFKVLERCEFLEKWTVAPRVIVDTFKIDKSTALYETMRRMNAQRNFYLHNKAAIAFGEEVQFEGSKSQHTTLSSDIDWAQRYISLPFDLSDHLRTYQEFILPSVILDRGDIVRAPKHNP